MLSGFGRRVIPAHRCLALTATCGQLAFRFRPNILQFRTLSVKDVYFVDDPFKYSIPDLPPPPLPQPSLEEMVATGESVLEELGLWSFFKPSSYFRWALESLHFYTDLPWFGTIILGTCILRLLLIWIPLKNYKMSAKFSQHQEELNVFKQRTMDAQREGDTLLSQQILMEQMDFLKSKGVNHFSQLAFLGMNGAVFMTQFFAIKKMASVNFPGFTTEGALWFKNLIDTDPYFLLPVISAVTLAISARSGIDFGNTEQLGPYFRIGLQWGVPIIVFSASSQFPAALCVYWCTSNFITLIMARFFKSEFGRRYLQIPEFKKYEKSNPLTEIIRGYKSKKQAPPTLATLKQRDMEMFKRAGRGKPEKFE